MFSYYDHGDGPAFGQFFRGFGGRMGRGDISGIVLRALREKPMHGYEIIRKLEEQSHGWWRPSAGSIYPTLQMLEEQDFVQSREEGGKKVYELTEAGREEAEKEPADNLPPHWHHHAERGKRFGFLKDTVKNIVVSMRTIGMDGSEEDLQRAKATLDETATKLHEIAQSIQADSRR